MEKVKNVNKSKYFGEIIQADDLDKEVNKVRPWKLELVYQLTEDL